MRFPEALVEQIAKGNCTLLLGSGISIAAGLPDRLTLMQPLAKELGAPPDLDPLDIADLYENKYGAQLLRQKIADATDTSDFDLAKAPYLLLLPRLPIETWITTNYDDLLERALQRAQRRYKQVVRNEDLPYTSADQLMLVKLHGDRTQPASLIVTASDFNTYFRRYELVKTQLAQLLVNTTLLFIGYEADEPAFLQLRDQIDFDLKQHGRRAYALMFTVDKWKTDTLAAKQIDVIAFGQATTSSEYNRSLTEALETLVEQVEEKRPRVEQPVVSDVTPPYQIIAEKLKQGQVIPILGVGAAAARSVSEAGWHPRRATYVPRHDELAQYLAGLTAFPKTEPIDLAKVAQYFDGAAGRDSLDAELHRVFGRDYQPGAVHRCLAGIDRPLLIVTTYYDDLMERALRDQGRPFDLVVQTQDEEYAASVLWWPHDDQPRYVPPNKLTPDLENRTIVYKTHGMVGRANQTRDAYFITEDDHVELLARTPAGMPSAFAEPFKTRSFLFLGYGLDYWPMRVIFSKLEREWPHISRGGKEVRSWAVQRNPSALEREFWQRRNIKVFDLPLDDFITNLQNYLQE